MLEVVCPVCFKPQGITEEKRTDGLWDVYFCSEHGVIFCSPKHEGQWTIATTVAPQPFRPERPHGSEVM